MDGSEPAFGTFQPTPREARLIALGRRLKPTWAGRRIASLIRSHLRRTRREPIDLEVIGQRMRLYAGNNSCEKRLIVTPQFFDPDELQFLRGRFKPGFTFLDVGCNVGAYSVFAGLNAGPGARVIAIDPNEIVLKRLRFNAKANGLDNITVVHSAVGDEDGEAEFALEEVNMGGSSLRLDRKARGGKTVFKVPVRTLAGIVKEAGLAHVDVLKIDVEGYEDRVLIPYLTAAPAALHPGAIIMEDSAASWYRSTGHMGHNGILVREAG